MVAAGGGGDAITAAALGPALGLTDERPVVMTYAWDRLIIDPLPGPRSASDFTGLRQLAPDVLEILPTTRPIPPAGSTLPRLAAELPARLLLIDPTEGAVGMTRQVHAAADYFGSSSTTLVDVGGDALTDGEDEGLRSPLADLLSLAACSNVDLPSCLLTVGLGLDGELAEETLLRRIADLDGKPALPMPGRFFDTVRAIFQWHPSEASGLLALAADGLRGLVEVRDSGSQIQITEKTSNAFMIDARKVLKLGPAPLLVATSSILEVRAILKRATGIAEVEYEERKARKMSARNSHAPTSCDLARVDTVAAMAYARNSVGLTVRRLAELIGVQSARHLNALRQLLSVERSAHYLPPLYRAY